METVFFSPPAVALIEFTVIVFILALTVGLVLTALNELFLRGLINRRVYKGFFREMEGRRFGQSGDDALPPFPHPKEIGFWASVLPYRQFCGRIYSFAAERGGRMSEESQFVERRIDELQVRIGTIWTWTMYYLAVMISVGMSFLFATGLEQIDRDPVANLMVTTSGAVLGGLIAPLLVQFLEKQLAAR